MFVQSEVWVLSGALPTFVLGLAHIITKAQKMLLTVHCTALFFLTTDRIIPIKSRDKKIYFNAAGTAGILMLCHLIYCKYGNLTQDILVLEDSPKK